MSAEALEAELERRHGLRLDGVVRSRLLRALDQDAAAAGTTRGAQVLAAVADPSQQQSLLDRITLQETAFFRDEPLWGDLAGRVLPAALAAAGAAPLVVWSAGCAHGQEAYALAMLLEELGAPGATVVASDVSVAATARAAAGRYFERELRGLGEERRRRFTTAIPGGRQIAHSVRARVRVVHHNAAVETPPVADGSCALVLCRYVLIYLTRPGAAALLDAVARALRPDGLLVIGAAESLWHLSDRFTPEPLEHAAAYRAQAPRAPARHAAGAASAALCPPPAGDAPPRAAPPPTGDAGARAAPSPSSPPPATMPGAPPPPPAPDASALVRAGETAAARTDASALARAGAPPPPPAPDASALVRAGEAAAARGDLPAAAVAFRGAAYLDASDAVALLRLGLVLEAMGDPGAERAFRSAQAAWAARPAGAEALEGYEPAAFARLLAGKLGATG